MWISISLEINDLTGVESKEVWKAVEVMVAVSLPKIVIVYQYLGTLSLSEDVGCPCCGGMTLIMMTGLAVMEYLATVWWQRWLNHDHCDYKLLSLNFSL